MKKKNIPTTVEDDNWMARDDANTLCRAEEIKMDPKRMASAAKAALKLKEEKIKELKGVSKIARKAGK
jgi:hypothetical protein